MTIEPNEPAPPLDEAAKALAASNAEFALDLYHHLRAKPGNIVISPYQHLRRAPNQHGEVRVEIVGADQFLDFAPNVAAGPFFDGARGETAEQMARVLRFPDRQALYSANRKVPVKMMHQDDGKFFYMHTDEFELLEMPYRGGRVSFLVLLPTEKVALADIEAGLTPQFLDRAIAQLKPSGIPVAFPQLKLKYRAELQSALKAMGMPRAFDFTADFSGIASERLCIDKVIHKAALDADEKGVVAAAATAVELIWT